MKLIVFGSTGSTGRQVVTQALQQGHDVTAFARSPEKLDLKHEKLQVIKGDVLDLDAVERAIQGQDAVLCTLGAPPTDKSNLRARGTKNIIHASATLYCNTSIYHSTFDIPKITHLSGKRGGEK